MAVEILEILVFFSWNISCKTYLESMLLPLGNSQTNLHNAEMSQYKVNCTKDVVLSHQHVHWFFNAQIGLQIVYWASYFGAAFPKYCFHKKCQKLYAQKLLCFDVKNVCEIDTWRQKLAPDLPTLHSYLLVGTEHAR